MAAIPMLILFEEINATVSVHDELLDKKILFDYKDSLEDASRVFTRNGRSPLHGEFEM